MTPAIRDAYNASTAVMDAAVTAGLFTREGAHRYNANPERMTEACAAWNEQVKLRKVADRMQADHMRANGRQYWVERGIAVGATVYAVTHNLLNPFVTQRVEGIAKVGRCGAYVSSKAQRGQLSPDSFNVT